MNIALGETFDFKFTSRIFATGVPGTLAGTPAVDIYEDNGTTQITSAETLTVDFDSVTGLNNLRIVATSGNGFEVGKSYSATIQAGTVSSVSVVGETICNFRIVSPMEKWGPAYEGPRGPGVYLNDAAANTSTVDGTDGTITNPVSTIAAAKTIADSLSLDRIYLVNDSAITLAATMDDYEFYGIGSPNANSIVLGSQSIDNSSFFNLTISGTQGGSARANFEDCLIGETLTLRCFARRCGFTDSAVGTSFSNNDDIVLDQCFSTVAGNGTPIFLAPGAGVDAMFRHYSGGVELKNLNATATISIESIGQVIFNATNNVNAAVTIRGFASITDNSAGMNNLTVDAVWNRTAYAADGSTLTAIDLPNQTMDITGNITGNLSGSVGSVTGNVGGVAGTIQTLDALDTALDLRFDSTDAKVDGVQLTLDGGVLVGSMGPNTITSTVIATDAIGASELAADAITEIQSGLSTLVATDIVSDGTAINTTAGAVDTVTTNTDMRGTDNAATAAALTTHDGKLDTVVADTNELQTDWANGGRLDLILDACSTHDAAAVVTALGTGSTLTSLATASALTAHDDAMANTKSASTRWLSAVETDGAGGFQYTTLALENAPSGGETAAAIADAVWDELQSGHVTPGTFGLFLDQAISSVSGGAGSSTSSDTFTATIIDSDTLTAEVMEA